MAVFEQLPGYLALAFRQGDDFSATVDFSINITGISWAADLRSPITGESVEQFTVTVTNAGSGILVVSLTDTETDAIPPGTWSWTLVGTVGGVRRTYFSGFVEVTA